MNDNPRIESLLRQEADQVVVPPEMPPRVRRRIRVRQGTTLVLSTLSVLAVVLAVNALPLDDREIPPARGNRAEEVLVTSRVDGVKWLMELRHTASGGRPEDDLICVVVRNREQCWRLDESSRNGEANVIVDYIRALERAMVIVRTPPKGDIQVRELSGTLWAGMVASEGDEAMDRPAIWYRLFEGQDVEGILSFFGFNAPKLAFSVQVDGVNVHTSVSKTDDEFPELSDFPGHKEVVVSGPDAGGYSVFRRTTESEVCLHLKEAVRCRARSAEMEPIRLWVTESLPCTTEDECGSDHHLTVIAGEVGEGVARIGIRDPQGTSFVEVGEPHGEMIFSTIIDGRLDAQAELVAFDSDGVELAVEPLDP